MVNFNRSRVLHSQLCRAVSIPQRDFGEFQLDALSLEKNLSAFQSLKGILVNFNVEPLTPYSTNKGFNPSKGFW
ncbi:hypothetical protein CKA32_001394 [Geitlerinema sp. FC II]|nr:hypothetical protein CKA32_001394 [Geitlerinema sp. FC II]